MSVYTVNDLIKKSIEDVPSVFTVELDYYMVTFTKVETSILRIECQLNCIYVLKLLYNRLTRTFSVIIKDNGTTDVNNHSNYTLAKCDYTVIEGHFKSICKYISIQLRRLNETYS